ncbi:MAG TPA: AAA family ATPase [Candidatus Sulfotelmatobacter sp.]|nr:AAA family ATPase [Candidatus Sulfotelmatobacter sp.]
MTDGLDRLKVLINSSTPIVVMETAEEMRAVNLVRAACADLNMATFEWTIADGLLRSGTQNSQVPQNQNSQKSNSPNSWTQASGGSARRTSLSPSAAESDRLTRALMSSIGNSIGGDAGATPGAAAGSAIYNTREPVQALANMETMTVEAVFILKDFHRHMDDPVVVRRLRDVGQKFATNRRTVIITAPEIVVPAELTTLVEYFDLPLPDRDRLRDIVHETFTRLSKTYTIKLQLEAGGVDAVAANLRGLTEEEAERAISQALVLRYALCAETVTDVLEAKKQLLRRSGMLEFVDASDNLASVGGLENLKHWLGQRRGAWEDSAREFGLEPPRGMIVLGVQGCGKSLCARAVAGEWKLPLVKFDTSAVYDKYIGETEKRIRKVFQVAEGLAPCVLWIDELEKVFAGSGPDSASADAGVSSRLLASFLSWMQDRKAAVFVAATCNNVTVLPPELIRKGRFDELFFVDLPNQAERKEIFAIQIGRRKRNPADFDLEKIAAAASGFSGAEIDAAVQGGMYAAFAEKKELNTQFLLDALAQTIPLSTTRAEEIETLRDWARTRAVPASAKDSNPTG